MLVHSWLHEWSGKANLESGHACMRGLGELLCHKIHLHIHTREAQHHERVLPALPGKLASEHVPLSVLSNQFWGATMSPTST